MYLEESPPEGISKETVKSGVLAGVRQDPDSCLNWLSQTFHDHSGLVALKPASLSSMELSFSSCNSDIACKSCGECVKRSGSHLTFAGRYERSCVVARMCGHDSLGPALADKCP